MSPSRYYTEIFIKFPDESQASWRVTDHGTLQAALTAAHYWVDRLGKKNVALFDRSPTRVEF